VKPILIFAAVMLINTALSAQTAVVPSSAPVIPANVPEAEKTVVGLLESMVTKPQSDMVIGELKQGYLTQEEYLGVLLTFSSFLLNHPGLKNASILIQTARFYVRMYPLILGTLREKDNSLLRAADKMVFLYFQTTDKNPQTETQVFQKIVSLFRTQVPEKLLLLKGMDLLQSLMQFNETIWTKYPDPIK